MPMKQKQWIELMRREGWRQTPGGSHQVKMTMAGRRPITLPDNHRRAYSKGFEAQLRREIGRDRGAPARTRDRQRQRDTGRAR
ncbi:MAG: hypothetical protein KGL16_06325 [Acidobacteriota bacterium]|nr:hypothetical protein [Acidobacteriota bacterium]